MQADSLYKCFDSTGVANESCISDLESLLENAPYFQPGWMLLAKCQQPKGGNVYDQTLSQTAARVFDRETLYNFIYLSNSISLATEETSSAKPQNEEVSKEKNVITKEKIATPLPIKDEEKEVREKDDLRSIVKERIAAIEEESKSKESKVENGEKIEQKEEAPIRTKLDIIENFIKQQPAINKPTDEEYADELAVAKKSLDEKFDFVSETLAGIYLKQGHNKKAAKIYKQLILKYPEKSGYFAAQIKKIDS